MDKLQLMLKILRKLQRTLLANHLTYDIWGQTYLLSKKYTSRIDLKESETKRVRTNKILAVAIAQKSVSLQLEIALKIFFLMTVIHIYFPL